MKRKTLYLISNAHLDPVWQWEWEEGAAAALSTFRCAVRFCEEFDGYIFCHNEALLYRYTEEYEPALFARIRDLVKAGKWHIMGGWHLQPDCNLPAGESFVRQIEEGRRYFAEKFGVSPTTAINFDPFGHTRGLVQILAKSGYDSYLFCRPHAGMCTLPAEDFTWVGYDGSTVTARRAQEGYNTALGHATDKIRGAAAALNDENPIGFCLWGVGDHGGGPSRADLRAIADYKAEAEKDGVRILHATPEDYFAAVRDSGKPLPRHEGDLNSWAPGCYTSQVRIKQKHRELENLLYTCEKMCAHAEMAGVLAYPEEEIGQALYDLLTAQFHDALPGSSVQGVEDATLRLLDHGLEILSRVRLRAFFALSRGQAAAREGEIPVLAYNPHPYAISEDLFCEFMLADQNWADNFTLPTVYDANGQPLPSQCEKEASNIPLDWRKRVVFRATLPPMSLSRFDCRLTTLEKKPVPVLPLSEDGKAAVFRMPWGEVRISLLTGLIDRVLAGGTAYLAQGAAALEVVRDNADPWGMTTDGWRDVLGQFALLSEEESTRFSDVQSPLPAVRAVEDGPVRTVVEAVFGYDTSRAAVRYLISRHAPQIDLEIRLFNNEKSRLIRLSLPCLLKNPRPLLEVAFGEEPMRDGGAECVGQKYLRVAGENGEMQICNRGIYGFSREGGTVRLTLLRSAGYTVHPIADRQCLPQDRYSPHMEQGERQFSVRLTFGKGQDAARKGLAFNETPFVLSFFPDENGQADSGATAPAISLTGDAVVMTLLRRAHSRSGWVVRLFNPTDREAPLTLDVPLLRLSHTATLSPFEVRTLYLTKEGVKPAPSMLDL